MEPAADRATHVEGGAISAAPRARFVDLARSLTEQQLTTRVPATPPWRIGDVLDFHLDSRDATVSRYPLPRHPLVD